MIAETVVWTGRNGTVVVSCSVRLTCNGVDLWISEGASIVRRERHPDRDSAYERARVLGVEFERRGIAMSGGRIS